MESEFLKPVSIPLKDPTYWGVVQLSLDNSTDKIDQEELLIELISKLPLMDIIGFRMKTDELLDGIHFSEMWCAGYIMNSGCGDDGFEYFKNWVVSRGIDVYNKAKTNPDSLVHQLQVGKDYYEFERFWYVANEAFKNRTEANLYDYIDASYSKRRSASYPNITFNWEEDEPETMQRICPRLYAACWSS